MKRVIFFMLIICFTASGCGSIRNVLNLGPKKTNTFKKVSHTYEKQLNYFFKNVFKTGLTGEEMFTSMKTTMEERIYQQMLRDIKKIAVFTKKHQTEEKFVLVLRGTKDYTEESEAYYKAIDEFLKDFVGEFNGSGQATSGRLFWESKDVKKYLTKAEMQPYIDMVMKAFKDDVIEKFKALKPEK